MLTALEFNQVPAQEAAFRSEIRQFLNEALNFSIGYVLPTK